MLPTKKNILKWISKSLWPSGLYISYNIQISENVHFFTDFENLIGPTGNLFLLCCHSLRHSSRLAHHHHHQLHNKKYEYSKRVKEQRYTVWYLLSIVTTYDFPLFDSLRFRKVGMKRLESESIPIFRNRRSKGYLP